MNSTQDNPKLLRVTLKDPDSLYDAVSEFIEDEFANSTLDEDEQEELQDLRRDKYNTVASKWFRYGEYLDIEINLTEGTARVLPAHED